MKIKRELLRLNEVNQNGRMYTREAAEKMIQDFNEIRKTTPHYGQMGMSDSMEMSLSKISHEVNSLELEGNSLVGSITVLDTIAGNKLKELIEKDQVVFRSRSLGTANPDGTVNVEKLISFDAIPPDQDSFKQSFDIRLLLG